MLKQLLIISGLSLLAQTVFAETCPAVADIRSNSLSGWKAFDSDDGTRLSAKREAQLKQSIKDFALAEWKQEKDKKTSSIHCYYSDKTGSSLEAYFAKDNFSPKKTNAFWYEVSGYMHCAAGMDKCDFESKGLANSQLAETQADKSLS